VSYATNPETRVARRTHTCHLCQGPILPGTEYRRWVYFDGYAIATKCHPDCENLWRLAAARDGTADEGSLHEALRWHTLAEVEREMGGVVTARIHALWRAANEGRT
jgi:hypothetical protein